MLVFMSCLLAMMMPKYYNQSLFYTRIIVALVLLMFLYAICVFIRLFRWCMYNSMYCVWYATQKYIYICTYFLSSVDIYDRKRFGCNICTFELNDLMKYCIPSHSFLCAGLHAPPVSQGSRVTPSYSLTTCIEHQGPLRGHRTVFSRWYTQHLFYIWCKENRSVCCKPGINSHKIILDCTMKDVLKNGVRYTLAVCVSWWEYGILLTLKCTEWNMKHHLFRSVV